MCPGCPAGAWAAAGRHPTPVQASTSVVVEVDVGPRYKACLLHNLTPPCAAGNRPDSYVAHTNGCTPQSGGCPGRRSPLPSTVMQACAQASSSSSSQSGVCLHTTRMRTVPSESEWWMHCRPCRRPRDRVPADCSVPAGMLCSLGWASLAPGVILSCDVQRVQGEVRGSAPPTAASMGRQLMPCTCTQAQSSSSQRRATGTLLHSEAVL
jgi:hypothetical protein